MTTFWLGSGGSAQVGAAIARGGEGAIHEVADDRNVVVKLYHDKTLASRGEELSAKLRAMIRNLPHNPTVHLDHQSLAWPVDTVHTASRLAGFVMPRLNIAQCAELHQVANPSDRADPRPPIPPWVATCNWDYLVRTAANLASAVAALHDTGYVVGDLNERNSIVTNRALVSLVDCDSMQVANPDGAPFLCRVGVPGYTAPELHGADLHRTVRAPSSDNFALAVLIYQLLMQGGHPFDGVWHGPEPKPSRAELARRGVFANTGDRHLTPRLRAPAFTMLPDTIQTLFARAFTAGATDPEQRPSAPTWHQALNEVATTLVRCPDDPTHHYANHLTTCPWCARPAATRSPHHTTPPPHTTGGDDPPRPTSRTHPHDTRPRPRTRLRDRLTTGDKIIVTLGTIELFLFQTLPWQHSDSGAFLWDGGVFSAYRGLVTWPAWIAYLLVFALVVGTPIHRLTGRSGRPASRIDWNRAILIGGGAIPSLLLLKLALDPGSVGGWPWATYIRWNWPAFLLIAIGVVIAYGSWHINREPTSRDAPRTVLHGLPAGDTVVIGCGALLFLLLPTAPWDVFEVPAFILRWPGAVKWPGWIAYGLAVAAVAAVLMRTLGDHHDTPRSPGWDQTVFLATLATPAVLLIKLAQTPRALTTVWAHVLVAIGIAMAYGGSLIMREQRTSAAARHRPPRRDHQPRSN